ncbi:MAG: hypothetical protein GFH27_549423n53, partial [Chloroflexi bacterium AL-W]|nr:hypothetical protein [Chloroflexi bacterium AL-W]
MFDQPLTRLTFVSLIAVSMVSCGQRGPTAAESFQAYPIATPTPTATIHPLDATKQADDERIERELATAAALPSPVVYPTPEPDLPTRTIETGLSIICERPSFQTMIGTNCWSDFIGEELAFVFVGADFDDPRQGRLDTYTVNLEQFESSPVDQYVTPTQSGAITITTVLPPRVFTE